MTEWAHRYVSDRAMPSYGPTHRIKVEAGLHHLQGNARPYFSVTATIYRPKANDCDACGCLHTEVLRLWPKLAPVVALHLCDDTGQPMHAEANGWYNLAGYYGGADQRYHRGNSSGQFNGEYRYPTPDECLAMFADHVRLPIDDCRTLANSWRCDDDWKASRRWFGQWLNTQAERFQTEATAACTLLDTLVASQALNSPR